MQVSPSGSISASGTVQVIEPKRQSLLLRLACSECIPNFSPDHVPIYFRELATLFDSDSSPESPPQREAFFCTYPLITHSSVVCKSLSTSPLLQLQHISRREVRNCYSISKSTRICIASQSTNTLEAHACCDENRSPDAQHALTINSG